MLWTIIVILVVLWLLGFIGHFGGALIHLLLVIAVVVLVLIVEVPRREMVSSSGSAGQSKALDLDIEHASRAGRSLCAVDADEIFS
jgi:hypothetical protein